MLNFDLMDTVAGKEIFEEGMLKEASIWSGSLRKAARSSFTSFYFSSSHGMIIFLLSWQPVFALSFIFLSVFSLGIIRLISQIGYDSNHYQ